MGREHPQGPAGLPGDHAGVAGDGGDIGDAGDTGDVGHFEGSPSLHHKHDPQVPCSFLPSHTAKDLISARPWFFGNSMTLEWSGTGHIFPP